MKREGGGREADKRRRWKLTDAKWCEEERSDRDRRRSNTERKEVSVLQGTLVRLVGRKLRWRCWDTDRCSMCRCLKRDHRVEILCNYTQHAHGGGVHAHFHACTPIHCSGVHTESKRGIRKRQKRDITWFLSNKCHRRHSAYFFCQQGPWRTQGNEHMSYWPQPLDSIMERFIEVKAKSPPVYSKGYWILGQFLGSLRGRSKC